MKIAIRITKRVYLLTLLLLPMALEAVIKQPTYSYNSDKTGLMMAIMLGQDAAINLLIEKKMELFLRDAVGNKAMHYAAYKNNVEAMKKLEKKGAYINPINKLEQTPLHMASAQGNTEAITWLLAKVPPQKLKTDGGTLQLNTQ